MVEDSGAKAGPGALRPIGLPRPIEVKADKDNCPVAAYLDGRWLEVQVLDRWRIDDEWWRESSISRAYFEVASEGLRLTLFQDLLSGQWYRGRG